ncbi:unnamed protein product [Notodromas monacha]|uniref:C1q domain-containing protein n=1 Tax=Notodromas monacha TaxID=399045 RepID=A0A7R9BX00_9CRUS|nr:unnamed protein product [Notodromas monacha]CAG0923340.1 unnamed protein product [Notodromas monacha]
MAKNRKKATFHWKRLVALAVNILITRVFVCDCKIHANQKGIDLPDAKDMQHNNPIIFTSIGQLHLSLSATYSKRIRPERVVLNVGHGLKPTIGYFVAPRDGIYLFNFAGLLNDVDIANQCVLLQHMGHEEYDSELTWKLPDPMTLAGHSLVSMKKSEVMEYFGRADSSTTDYLNSLGFLHNNWWRLSGRLIADSNDLDAVAFSVAEIPDDSMESPKEFHWNIGNGFNSAKGTFIAPKAGLYHFFLQFAGQGNQGEARIEKPDLVLAAGLIGEFDEHSVEIDTICKLDEGESVFVSILGKIVVNLNEIKFSGFLVK